MPAMPLNGRGAFTMTFLSLTGPPSSKGEKASTTRSALFQHRDVRSRRPTTPSAPGQTNPTDPYPGVRLTGKARLPCGHTRSSAFVLPGNTLGQLSVADLRWELPALPSSSSQMHVSLAAAARPRGPVGTA